MLIKTRKWSTPLILGSSLVVATTGAMMFFHLGEGLLKLAHEWVGMLFLVAMVFHILNHWVPVKNYFAGKFSLSIIASAFIIAIALTISSTNSPHPIENILIEIEHSSIQEIAALQNKPIEKVATLLSSAGMDVKSHDQTLLQIAQENSAHIFDITDIVFTKK